MPDANWFYVLFSLFGSVCTALLLLIGVAIAWGRYSQQVKDLFQRQETANGKIDRQAEKDGCLDTRVSRLETTCLERKSVCQRNEQEHAEIFTRVIALENGYAALPGHVTAIIDDRFKQWRKDIKADIRSVVYEIEENNRRSYRDRRQEGEVNE